MLDNVWLLQRPVEGHVWALCADRPMAIAWKSSSKSQRYYQHYRLLPVFHTVSSLPFVDQLGTSIPHLVSDQSIGRSCNSKSGKHLCTFTSAWFRKKGSLTSCTTSRHSKRTTGATKWIEVKCVDALIASPSPHQLIEDLLCQAVVGTTYWKWAESQQHPGRKSEENQQKWHCLQHSNLRFKLRTPYSCTVCLPAKNFYSSYVWFVRKKEREKKVWNLSGSKSFQQDLQGPCWQDYLGRLWALCSRWSMLRGLENLREFYSPKEQLSLRLLAAFLNFLNLWIL